ncbi:MAG: MMPL family transporter, partial [Solirubrobacteraceae bacterium]
MIALWLALIVACFAGGSIAGTRSLSDAASGSGQSAHAEAQLQHAGLLDSFTENVIVRSSSPAKTAHAVAAIAAGAGRQPYVTSVQSARTEPALSRSGGRTGLVVVKLRGDPDHQDSHVKALQSFVTHTAHATRGVYIGEVGDGSSDVAMNNLVSNGLHKAELIALPITLVILVLVFGALVAALVPLVLGLTSVAAAMGALGIVSHVAAEGTTTAPVVILIGLAVGIDYSLFYIRRERAERRLGAGPEAALDASAATVGRAILIAGTTVIIGLAGLLFTGNAVFVSMALGAILVVAIAVLGSLTVLPAVLTLLGDRVDRGRLWRRRSQRSSDDLRRTLWGRVAGAVTARPRLSLTLALVLLAGLAAPILSMHTTNPELQDAPKNSSIRVAQRALDAAFPGANDTAELVVSGHGLGTAAARVRLRQLGQRGQRLTGNASGQVNVRVSRDGDTALIEIPVPTGPISTERRTTDTLRSALEPATPRALPAATAQLTGGDASDVDFTNQMNTMTPLVIGFVLGLAFILLVCSFGSPLLAVSVIGLNLASVGAAFGALTLVFQHHWAQSLLAFQSFGGIVNWLPLFAFVVLFGLSMDYTVLILERAAEARRRGASAREAAAEALGATGATVTSAAIVM